MASRARLVWTAPALDDLDEIASWIAVDNRAAARALVKVALEAVERLRDNPDSGRWLPELTGRIYREVLVSRCRIIYRRDRARVLVIHVMRQERKLRKNRLL